MTAAIMLINAINIFLLVRILFISPSYYTLKISSW